MPGATVTGADFMCDLTVSGESRLRIGSLLSGHGGLGNDSLIWPHRDGLIWPRVRHTGAVVTV